MTKQEMVRILLQQIDTSDSVSGDYVLIRKEHAMEIIRMLTGEQEIKQAPKDTDGKILFYCMDCSRSFLAEGREDREWFERWQYHTWHANCPYCHTEVTQTDRYWR